MKISKLLEKLIKAHYIDQLFAATRIYCMSWKPSESDGFSVIVQIVSYFVFRICFEYSPKKSVLCCEVSIGILIFWVCCLLWNASVGHSACCGTNSRCCFFKHLFPSQSLNDYHQQLPSNWPQFSFEGRKMTLKMSFFTCGTQALITVR